MDPITAAILAALSTGAASGFRDTAKVAITDGYNKLKELLTKKYGASSDVVQAIDKLEAKPTSAGRQGTLAEEVKEAGADQDGELLALVEQIRHLLKEHARENAAVQQIITGSYDATSVHGNATITVDHFKGFL